MPNRLPGLPGQAAWVCACQNPVIENGTGTTLWVVAGCLFEISLPAAEGGPWEWVPAGEGEVTLVAELGREDRQHFRFRAEAAGVGVVTLQFRGEAGGRRRQAVVRVSPE
jgi:hypothetical protein